MRLVRRLLVAVTLLSLVTAGSAVANHLDPQKKIRPADQARARAMLLKKADLRFGYKAQPSSDDPHVICKALDESDFTLTGEAESPDFALGGIAFVSSLAQVYESPADANASWQRGTSAAGERCARDEYRRYLQSIGGRLLSFRKIAFPHRAQRSVAYRLVALSQARVYFDLIFLQQSRAQAALLIGSALGPPPRDEELRLTRIVAGRMAKAMRGA